VPSTNRTCLSLGANGVLASTTSALGRYWRSGLMSSVAPLARTSLSLPSTLETVTPGMSPVSSATSRSTIWLMVSPAAAVTVRVTEPISIVHCSFACAASATTGLSSTVCSQRGTIVPDSAGMPAPPRVTSMSSASAPLIRVT
jgi:hypothetical protein